MCHPAVFSVASEQEAVRTGRVVGHPGFHSGNHLVSFLCKVSPRRPRDLGAGIPSPLVCVWDEPKSVTWRMLSMGPKAEQRHSLTWSCTNVWSIWRAETPGADSVLALEGTEGFIVLLPTVVHACHQSFSLTLRGWPRGSYPHLTLHKIKVGVLLLILKKKSVNNIHIENFKTKYKGSFTAL